jgi:glycosyltransferase involved in cell wall biosynthesis
LKQKAKEVLVVHDLLFRRKDLPFSKIMKIQRYFYLPISLKRANKIVAISETTAKDICAYYGDLKKDITVIYNSFRFDKYTKNEGGRIENYFLSICSSQPHKNSLTLLKAFEQYCYRGGKNNLTLVGAISGNTSIESFYEGLPKSIKERIIVVSKISNEELSKWYSHASAFVSASLFEGLGMPVVEAMYFGIPLILSDIPIFHEVSREKAEFFSPLDVDQLCVKLLSNISQRFDNTLLLDDMFSVENTSQRFMSLLNSLL